MAVTMKICSVGCAIEIYQRFGRTCYFRITTQRTEFYDCLKVFQPPFRICSMTAHHILLRFMALTTLDVQQRHSSASPTRRLTATLATSPLLPTPARFYIPTLRGDRVQSVSVTQPQPPTASPAVSARTIAYTDLFEGYPYAVFHIPQPF